MPYLSVECKLSDLNRVSDHISAKLYIVCMKPIITLEEVLNLSFKLTECG